jgi:TolB-like protein/DNA-binding winged helix-turn-helix (wHTH) protein
MKYSLADLTIDTGRQLVSRGANPIPLPKLSFDLFLALVRAAPNLVSLDELMGLVWPGVIVSPETVSQRVKLLRDALDDDPRAPRYIGGLRGRGYQIVAAVNEVVAGGELPAASVPEEIAAPSTRDSSATQDGVALEATPAHQQSISHAASPRGGVWRIAGPGLAVTLLLAALAVWAVRERRQTVASGIPNGKMMLAVLPFQNLSNDPQQEYLSDGLTEETIADLGELNPERLGVIARTSAMLYKHADKTITEIGRELGADYILEGSIRREGQTIRVTAQLIRVKDQSHLWAHNYQRELTGLLALQSELGTAIAQQVQVKLVPKYANSTTEKYVPQSDAYDLYLQGLYYLNKRTPNDIQKSIDYFGRSIQKDQSFALAYAALASAYLTAGVNASQIVEPYPKALAAASRALELDDGLADAHAVLGAEKAAFEYNWTEAEVQLRRAVALSPNFAYAHFVLSLYYLTPQGQSAEAIAEMKKALELDPLSPTYNTTLGFTYYQAHQYEKALEQYNWTLRLRPDFYITHGQLARLYAQLEQYPNAITEITKFRVLVETRPNNEIAADNLALKKAFAAEGGRGFWREIQAQQARDVPPIPESQIDAGLGETDMALESLRLDYERRAFFIIFINVDPPFAALRSDPRFIGLVKQMGLIP